MPSWYKLPQVEYYAGRYFTHLDKQYTPGEKVPRELVNKWGSVEAAIRSRHLIPIAADYHDIPRHVYPEAKHYEEMLRRHREHAIALNLPALEQSGPPVTEVPQKPKKPDEPKKAEETPASPARPARSVEDTPDISEYDPTDDRISEVLAHVDEHPEQAEEVLEKERRGKARTRLITALEERLTAPE